MAHISMAVKNLNKAYLDGNIIYPRVNNSYIPTHEFQFYPHPPLNEFDNYSTPLLFREYEMTRESLLLYLNEKGLLLPSKILNTYNFINKYVDYDLKIRNMYKDEVNKKVDIYKEFKEKHGIKNIITSTKFKESQVYYYPMELTPFKIKLTPETVKKKDKKKKFVSSQIRRASDYNIKQKHNINAFVGLKNGAINVNNIDEAVEMYKKIRRYRRMKKLEEKMIQMKKEFEKKAKIIKAGL